MGRPSYLRHRKPSVQTYAIQKSTARDYDIIFILNHVGIYTYPED